MLGGLEVAAGRFADQLRRSGSLGLGPLEELTLKLGPAVLAYLATVYRSSRPTSAESLPKRRATARSRFASPITSSG